MTNALSTTQALAIVCVVAAGTIITRFLPFILFNGRRASNSYIQYLGQVLPYAAIGLLVVYCLKNVDVRKSAYGIPEAIAIFFVVSLHYWKSNALLSIGAGTAIYMVLVQTIFA